MTTCRTTAPFEKLQHFTFQPIIFRLHNRCDLSLNNAPRGINLSVLLSSTVWIKEYLLISNQSPLICAYCCHKHPTNTLVMLSEALFGNDLLNWTAIYRALWLTRVWTNKAAQLEISLKTIAEYISIAPIASEETPQPLTSSPSLDHLHLTQKHWRICVRQLCANIWEVNWKKIQVPKDV